jgi:hypothetical protein
MFTFYMLIRLGPHERTKCVRCNERHDIAVEIERKPKIQARHDVRQEGRACLVCWDLLISFYFYNRCHDARYNGRILWARVAPV